jgi:drug/metabolite transporter (DMT)-like permease
LNDRGVTLEPNALNCDCTETSNLKRIMTITAPHAPAKVASAVMLMLGAMAILPVMDSAAKYLGMFMPVAMCVWARFFFQSVFVAPVVIHKYGPGVLLPKDAGFQIGRSLCLVFANGAFFWGLRFLPLADMLALFFISPILVTALSPFVLGEKVDTKRWLAVLVGFAGVLVIIRPGFEEVNAGTALGILSGVLYAVFVLLTRRIRGLPVLVTTLYNALPGAIAVTLLAPLFWQWPTMDQWLLLLAIGIISICAHYMLIMSFERAPASLLAPFAYSEIISGTIVGYYWFGDMPDSWTFAGAAILIASGLFISWHETRRTESEILEAQ